MLALTLPYLGPLLETFMQSALEVMSKFTLQMGKP